MKTILTIIASLFVINLFSQQIIIFSIGVGYRPGMEQKVEKYLEKRKDKYELLFVCPEQKIFAVKTDVKGIKLIESLTNRFTAMFIFRTENEITGECKDELNKIVSNNQK